MSKSDRNPGIDLLRVILSFCVIALHVLHFGGFEAHTSPENAGYYLLWFMGIVPDCAVNCFAIISGYVLYNQMNKYTNLIRLLFTVLYHGLLITVAFQLFAPHLVTYDHWLKVFAPVTQETFWYFTSYYGIFFFIPLLTNGMRALSKKQATTLVVSLLVVFSLLPAYTNRDPFNLSEGFSVLWLMVLFIVGTYLKKYGDSLRFKKRVLIGVFALCILTTCLVLFLTVHFPWLKGMRLLRYTSPTIVIAAISAVLLFASMRLPAFLEKGARYCTPFVFSVYLIHEHPLIRQNLIKDRFLFAVTLPAIPQVLTVIGITDGIWICCFLLEFIRQQIFRLLKIDVLLKKLEAKLDAWFQGEKEPV